MESAQLSWTRLYWGMFRLFLAYLGLAGIDLGRLG